MQRITLLDAPAALGWETIREVEAPSFQLTELGIRRAIDEGRIARRPPGPLAHLLFGALCEGAMTIARADDPAAAQRAVWAELREGGVDAVTLLDGDTPVYGPMSLHEA